ncbi:MAG TPA: hypothetical protein P5313_15590 [Spirochaetia bacterium]|nr:hypothetical protein [Spirochaetales bacterium]HRY81838.1 hypothetical protein [Spirochaetia bacterium]
MDSELAAAGAGWAAAALGGLSLGAAAAFCLLALSAGRSGRGGKPRRVLSGVSLGLAAAVACLAALLILPPKPLLADRTLWIWAGAWGALGCLSAFFPGRAGIPLAVLVLSFLGLAAGETSVWHPLVPGREVARLVPYEATAAGASGDLAVPDRNAVPVLSRVRVEGSDCALEARVLDLAGPLAPLFGPRRYRLSRLTGGGGGGLLDFPRKPGPLTGVLEGREFSVGWVSLRTVRSPALPLEALRALSWSFDGEGELEARLP